MFEATDSVLLTLDSRLSSESRMPVLDDGLLAFITLRVSRPSTTTAVAGIRTGLVRTKVECNASQRRSRPSWQLVRTSTAAQIGQHLCIRRRRARCQTPRPCLTTACSAKRVQQAKSRVDWCDTQDLEIEALDVVALVLVLLRERARANSDAQRGRTQSQSKSKRTSRYSVKLPAKS
jgi:hypothetical protein